MIIETIFKKRLSKKTGNLFGKDSIKTPENGIHQRQVSEKTGHQVLEAVFLKAPSLFRKEKQHPNNTISFAALLNILYHSLTAGVWYNGWAPVTFLK